MRSLVIAMTAFAALAVAGTGTAEAKTKTPSAKSVCKKEAKEKGLKGAEAKSFVKDCVAQKKEHKEEAPAAK
jgi:hypothetical protein